MDDIKGGHEHWTPDMQQLKDCTIDTGIETIRTVGDPFTWTNNRLGDAMILKRLDRMLGNQAWFNNFYEGQVIVKNRCIMDHSPLVMIVPMELEKIRKPFQFFNYMIGLMASWRLFLQFGELICMGIRWSFLTRKCKW